MMVTTRYGKGRIFHQVLGHVWWVNPEAPEHKGSSMMSFENEHFQRTLLRGCEWAATGKATLK
jgi:type 1 glutamine amidotransferase